MNASLSGTPAPRSASSPASPEGAAQTFLGRLKTPCRLLIAYSGGGDSTGLMVALAECLKARPGLDIRLVAATVDHGLRADSADEARAAGALCERLSIPHHVLTWQGQKPKTGIQAAAREARYRLLGTLARAVRADLMVSAHNLNDQIETIAMRRARNPAAAGGMSEATLYDRHLWIFRPFLGVRRADIRQYLIARGIGWVDDPSNDNEAFERVRVRKSLPAGGEPSGAAWRDDRASETARYLRAVASIHTASVATLDLSRHERETPAHLDAVRHLAAMMGGRTHLAGAETTDRLAGFLESGEGKSLSAERVVFDRRRDRLFITRERRGLPVVHIAPGTAEIWDNRFRITNSGTAPILVGVRGDDHAGVALIAGDLPDVVPGSVRQRIRATEPVLLEGSPDAVRTEPIIAAFDRFLPLAMLEVANALAFLGGLDHFPALPTR